MSAVESIRSRDDDTRLVANLGPFGVSPALARAWRRRRNASIVEFAALRMVIAKLGLPREAESLFVHAHDALRAMPPSVVSAVLGSPHALAWLRRCFECVDVLAGRAPASRLDRFLLHSQTVERYRDELIGRAALLPLAASALMGRTFDLAIPMPVLRATTLPCTRWHLSPDRPGALLQGIAAAPIASGCALLVLSAFTLHDRSIVFDPFDHGLATDAGTLDEVVTEPAPLVPFESLFADAMSLIGSHAPAVLDELALAYYSVAPMVTESSGFPSGTTSSSVGHSVFTTPPAAAILAEMLVHEASHGHLFVTQDIDPLLSPAHHGTGWEIETLYSPWRDDPRPLNGILHGAYVFARVARLWMAFECGDVPEARDLARRRLAVLRLQLALARDSLARHARWTEFGSTFFAALDRELGAVVEETRSLDLDAVAPIYSEAASTGRAWGRASERQRAHFKTWRARHPSLDLGADERIAELVA
jgi:hypothetical protein